MVNAVKIYYEDIMDVLDNDFDLRNKLVALVDKYKSTEKRGREIKKIYIPDNRCVIEEKADMGNLIFLKSIYTGL